MTRRETNGRDRKAGSILVLTVWVLLVLCVLAVAVGVVVSANIQTARYLRDRTVACYAARAGVESAEAVLSGVTNMSAIQGEAGQVDQWRNVPVGEGLFSVFNLEPGPDGGVLTNSGVAMEERKINVNYATNEVGRQLLRALFETAGGLEFDTADAMADCVADWVDPDNIPLANGAESMSYQTLTGGYACHDGPMDDIHELTLIKGMTGELFRKVAPYLTVCGMDGQVNLNAAAPVVLASLAGARKGTDPAVGRALADRIVDFRQRGNMFVSVDKREIRSLLFPSETLTGDEQAEWGILEWLLNHRMVTVQSRYYYGICIGTSSHGSVAGREIAFVYDGRDDRVKAWNEY